MQKKSILSFVFSVSFLTSVSLGQTGNASLSGVPEKPQNPTQQNFNIPPQGHPVGVYMMRPTAPDMCGPGFFYVNQCGMIYGPNYCVRPPFATFNGLVPAPGCGNMGAPMGGRNSQFPGMSFPSHPFARSPRDFFMVD